MTYLDCCVRSCASNRDNCCCRSDIKVKGKDAHRVRDTRCASFHAEDSFASSFISNEAAYPETQVLCDVKNCAFCESGTCAAERISMEGSNAGESAMTRCASFVER